MERQVSFVFTDSHLLAESFVSSGTKAIFHVETLGYIERSWSRRIAVKQESSGWSQLEISNSKSYKERYKARNERTDVDNLEGVAIFPNYRGHPQTKNRCLQGEIGFFSFLGWFRIGFVILFDVWLFHINIFIVSFLCFMRNVPDLERLLLNKYSTGWPIEYYREGPVKMYTQNDRF